MHLHQQNEEIEAVELDNIEWCLSPADEAPRFGAMSLKLVTRAFNWQLEPLLLMPPIP